MSATPPDPADAASRLSLWGALAVALMAFLLRVTHLRSLEQSPLFDAFIGDAWRYHSWAQEIAAGDWLGAGVFYQAPLYPYFLATLYTTVGDDLWTIRLVQALLGAAACGLLALAAARFFRSRWIGIVAGGILALYAPAIFHDALVQKSVLDTFLLCLLLYLCSRTLDRPRVGLCLAAGLALGAMVLSRENALLIGVALVAWLLLRPAQPLRRRAAAAGALALGAALLLGPVALRNAWVGGEFHLTSSQFGHNLYIGNHPGADGTYQPLVWGRGDSEWADGRALAEKALGRTLGPAEISAYWTDRSLDTIRDQPLDWLGLLARKFTLLWNATEIIDTEDQYTHARYSPILAATGAILHFGVLAPLALLGVIVSWPRRRDLWLLYAMFGAYAATLMVFFVLARYRLPLVPLLAPFAAAALASGPGWIRGEFRTRPRKLAVVTVAVIGLALFANGPHIDRVGMQATNLYNLAVAQRRAGDPRAAIESLERAVAIVPVYAEAHLALANLLGGEGDFEAALAQHALAVRFAPHVAATHHAAGLAFSESARFREANEAFDRAVALDPAFSEAHYYNALARLRRARNDEARASMVQAIALEPGLRERLRYGAWLLATAPGPSAPGDAARALHLAQWAVRIGGVDDAESLSTLSAAFARNGRFDPAVSAAKRALALARAGVQPIEVAVMQNRLRILEAGQRLER